MNRLAVCKEHLEFAIDIYVDEYEAAPDVMRLRDAVMRFPDWTPPETCARCGDKPEFMVCAAELVE